MIKKNLAVTKNARLNQQTCDYFFADSSDNDPMIGVYFSINAASAISPDRLSSLTELVQKYYGHPPDFYLRLELSHKGRVDARLFADAECTRSITLNMLEDGDSTVNGY